MSGNSQTGFSIRAPKGQSLVETAMFLPILLILLAGVVEISNLLLVQNRVSTAVRSGTGFGATRYAADGWDDLAPRMGLVTLNTVTDTLDLAPDHWDMWAIRGRTNETGDGFALFEADRHVYGENNVISQAEWDDIKQTVASDILAELRADGANAQDLAFIATAGYYSVDSPLNLDLWNWSGLNPVRALTVMRVDRPRPYTLAGCELFPITLDPDNYSLYPENYIGIPAPIAGAEYYDKNYWDYPKKGPHSGHLVRNYSDDPYDHSGFPTAIGGRRLPDAKPGDIFLARENEGPGAFGWLSWDGSTNQGSLAASLVYPGNLSLDPPPATPPKINYVNPDDPSDYLPNVGDWVQGSTGNMNSINVRNELESLISLERPIAMMMFDQTRGSGANLDFRIGGTAVIILRAYKTTANSKEILIEFVSWPEACGALPES